MEQLRMKNVRVALAEDDSDQRQILALILKQLGYSVACQASNGAELLSFCEQEQADVALVDLDMPLLDGLEAAEELSRRGIPVVLISGLAESDNLVVELEPIAVRLSKPAKSEDIQQAIRTALATRPVLKHLNVAE
jgi:CheY-like chemotaxis protein